MALFVEPAPLEEAAEFLARQLGRVRDRFPTATVWVAPPGGPPELLLDQWRVVVETEEAGVDDLKRECLDLLGE